MHGLYTDLVGNLLLDLLGLLCFVVLWCERLPDGRVGGSMHRCISLGECADAEDHTHPLIHLSTHPPIHPSTHVLAMGTRGVSLAKAAVMHRPAMDGERVLGIGRRFGCGAVWWCGVAGIGAMGAMSAPIR